MLDIVYLALYGRDQKVFLILLTWVFLGVCLVFLGFFFDIFKGTIERVFSIDFFWVLTFFPSKTYANN